MREVTTPETTVGAPGSVYVRRDGPDPTDPGGDEVVLTGIVTDFEVAHFTYRSHSGFVLTDADGNTTATMKATPEAFNDVYELKPLDNPVAELVAEVHKRADKVSA
jgi:hypothetical protein